MFYALKLEHKLATTFSVYILIPYQVCVGVPVLHMN